MLNLKRLLFLTTLSITFIANSPDIQAIKTPMTAGPAHEDSKPPVKASFASKIAEPSIAGIEIRKAYLIAVFLSSPVTRPPASVAPDLEIPGQIAIP